MLGPLYSANSLSSFSLVFGFCDILSVFVHVTNIEGAHFHNMAQHTGPGDFGAKYFSPVP